MQYLGNKEILKEYKVGFLCSRKIPSDIILKTYDWAIAKRDSGECVVSGFHSKIEKDVLHYLLKGNQPLILVLARGLYKRVPDLLRKELDKNRLLIISVCNQRVKRSSEISAQLRNHFIIELSDELFVPFASSGGLLEKANEYAKERNKKITYNIFQK